MKTIPLVIARLKGFVRNWRSIFLLIVVPLILISVIFVAFNPLGLQKTPVGIIMHEKNANFSQVEDTISSFLIPTHYETLQSCIDDLKVYKQYVCIDMVIKDSIVLTVHYDNTRPHIIWEILAKIEGSVDYLQSVKSQEMAEQFFDEFSHTIENADEFLVYLRETNGQIDNYILEVDNTITKLQSTRQNIEYMLGSFETNLGDVEDKKEELETEKDDFYIQSVSSIDSALDMTYDFANITEYDDYLLLSDIRIQLRDMRSKIQKYNREADDTLREVDNMLVTSRNALSNGKRYIRDIDNYISKLRTLKNELTTFKGDLEEAETKIEGMLTDFDSIQSMDPEVLVNPIVLTNRPVYIPEIRKEFEQIMQNATSGDTEVEKAFKGLNMLNLQTMFPIMLSLIVIFLSLLVSSFICLHDINSSAKTRIRMVKGIFTAEFLSVYISSLLVILVPTIIVLMLGHYMFMINVLQSAWVVLLLMWLLTSIFALLGMILAYLIKKESTTLLISTFVLVFVLFFSGFLLPIERMTQLAGSIASNFPGELALNAFSKAVFYSMDFVFIQEEVLRLALWLVILTIIALIIKKIRRV